MKQDEAFKNERKRFIILIRDRNLVDNLCSVDRRLALSKVPHTEALKPGELETRGTVIIFPISNCR